MATALKGERVFVSFFISFFFLMLFYKQTKKSIHLSLSLCYLC